MSWGLVMSKYRLGRITFVGEWEGEVLQVRELRIKGYVIPAKEINLTSLRSGDSLQLDYKTIVHIVKEANFKPPVYIRFRQFIGGIYTWAAKTVARLMSISSTGS